MSDRRPVADRALAAGVVERSLADIQLLGSGQQVAMAKEIAGSLAGEGTAGLDDPKRPQVNTPSTRRIWQARARMPDNRKQP